MWLTNGTRQIFAFALWTATSICANEKSPQCEKLNTASIIPRARHSSLIIPAIKVEMVGHLKIWVNLWQWVHDFLVSAGSSLSSLPPWFYAGVKTDHVIIASNFSFPTWVSPSFRILRGSRACFFAAPWQNVFRPCSWRLVAVFARTARFADRKDREDRKTIWNAVIVVVVAWCR